MGFHLFIGLIERLVITNAKMFVGNYPNLIRNNYPCLGNAVLTMPALEDWASVVPPLSTSAACTTTGRLSVCCRSTTARRLRCRRLLCRRLLCQRDRVRRWDLFRIWLLRTRLLLAPQLLRFPRRSVQVLRFKINSGVMTTSPVHTALSAKCGAHLSFSGS